MSNPAAEAKIAKRVMRGEQTDLAPSRDDESIDTTRTRLADALQPRRQSQPEQMVADVEDCGYFSTRRYANAAGERDYKRDIASSFRDAPVPLIVMLQGSTQDT